MTTEFPRRILAREFLEALQGAGIIRHGDYARRVIIDARLGAAVIVYAERIGDERLLDIVRTMDGAEIRNGTPARGPQPVLLTAGELLLIRQRLAYDGPGTPAIDSELDAKLYQAQRELEKDST